MPGIDNLTRAMNLAAKDGSGWEALTGYAADPTGMPLPDKKDTFCAPADPVFEIKQLETLAKETGTNEAEWGYPVQPGVEVRAAMQPNAPVIEKLGMHFVRVMEDDGPEPPPNQMPMLKVVAPSGKVGYVPGRRRQPAGQRSALLRQGRRRAGRSPASSAASSKPTSSRNARRALEYARAFVVIVLDGRRPRM